MIFKRFYTIIIIRILLIVATVFLFVYLVMHAKNEMSSIFTGMLILFQAYALIVYVNRTNLKLSQFFDSIRYADFSTTFSESEKGNSFKALSQSFNNVMDEFRKYRAEKEEHYNYLQTVVQHINIGILCFNSEGKVDMYNKAARKLFRMNLIRNVHDLQAVKDDFPQILLNLKAGDKILVKVFAGDELKQLSIYATEFRMRGDDFVLVAFQDIHTELEQKEIESWQKLIRVLTHEIMNSITPISSLASTISDMLIDSSGEKPALKSLDEEEVLNVESAIQTISKRSTGLLNFVDIYRNLTRIPQPNFRYFRIKEAFERAEQLLQQKMEEHDVDCQCLVYPEDLMLTADPDLIDQIIINLLLNSLDAVKNMDKPRIVMKAFKESQKTVIEISDNGSGIKQDILEKIFMPFFTSKKHGSGIGLSLSRQIMYLHRGSISVRSKPDEGAVFTLIF